MLQHTWFLLLIFSNKSISILIGRPHPRPVRSAPTLGLRPSRKIVSDPEPCGRNPILWGLIIGSVLHWPDIFGHCAYCNTRIHMTVGRIRRLSLSPTNEQLGRRSFKASLPSQRRCLPSLAAFNARGCLQCMAALVHGCLQCMAALVHGRLQCVAAFNAWLPFEAQLPWCCGCHQRKAAIHARLP